MSTCAERKESVESKLDRVATQIIMNIVCCRFMIDNISVCFYQQFFKNSLDDNTPDVTITL